MLVAVLVIQALTLTLPAIGLNHHHAPSEGPANLAASGQAMAAPTAGGHRHAEAGRHWHAHDAATDLIVDDDLIEEVLEDLLTRLAASGMPMTRVSARVPSGQPWLLRCRRFSPVWPPTWAPDVPHLPPIV